MVRTYCSPLTLLLVGWKRLVATGALTFFTHDLWQRIKMDRLTITQTTDEPYGVFTERSWACRGMRGLTCIISVFSTPMRRMSRARGLRPAILWGCGCSETRLA